MKIALAFSFLLTSPVLVLGTIRGLNNAKQTPDDAVPVSRELYFGDWINVGVNSRAEHNSLRKKLGRPGERNGWKQPNNNKKSNGNAVSVCNIDEDCGDDAYCASGSCLAMGSCNDVWDCRNPSNSYPVIECLGPLFCTNNQCGRTCGPLCADGFDETECTLEPCSVASESCRGDFVSCTNDFCDGCNALLFNARGDHELCPTEDGVGTPKEDTVGTCTSSSDCGEEEYCSRGVCVEKNTCVTDADCFNPDNNGMMVLCVGPRTCNTTVGQCSITCADNECPADKPPVQCLVSPCESLETTCDDGVASCVDYYCGDCSAFAFSADGYQVCTDEVRPVVPGTPCESSKDCGHTEYCADGVCLDQGSCNSVEDCSNPDNFYNLIMCVGPIICDDGRCGRDCTEDSSLPSAPGTPCESSKDCGGTEYCAAGVCLEQGACKSDLDCFNPGNQYPVILCIGPLFCFDNGRCGRECAATSCPSGAPEADCPTSPCENPPSCVEEWEYCIDSICDGECGFMLLDAAGFEVKCTADED